MAQEFVQSICYLFQACYNLVLIPPKIDVLS
jgi:hypothetical protein